MDGAIPKYVQLTLCCAVEKKKKKIFEIKKEIYEWWVEWTFRLSHSELEPVGNSRVFPLVWGTLRHVCLQQCTAVFHETLGNNPLGNNWKYLPLREALYAVIFFSLKSSSRLAVSATPNTNFLSSSRCVHISLLPALHLPLGFLLRGAINSYFLLLLQLVELIDFKFNANAA